MTQPTVVLASLWRNDAERNLPDRVEHLLAKAELYPACRWLWVVGDSGDDTLTTLAQLCEGYDVTIVVQDTGILGDDSKSHLCRLSQTANAIWRNVRAADDYVVVHESDIQSPIDLLPLLMRHVDAGRECVAGWPLLQITPGRWIFYDRWAYRRDGVMFRHRPPYHKCFDATKPFEVDSFGSVYMLPAYDARHIVMESEAVLDLCAQLKERKHTLWVDPSLTVIQPHSLWTPRKIDSLN